MLIGINQYSYCYKSCFRLSEKRINNAYLIEVIIQNAVDTLSALGYDMPKNGLLAAASCHIWRV